MASDFVFFCLFFLCFLNDFDSFVVPAVNQVCFGEIFREKPVSFLFFFFSLFVYVVSWPISRNV